MYKDNVSSVTPYDAFYKVVVEVVCKVFGRKYVVPTTFDSEMTEKQKLSSYAIKLILEHLRSATNQMKTDSSLFRENYSSPGNDFTNYYEQYSRKSLLRSCGWCYEYEMNAGVVEQLT
jgi:hypothetical protein